MKRRFKIYRTRIGRDIVAEFVIPPTERLRKKGRVAIIAKGVPTMPGGTAFLEFLAREGFYTILPRYRGTWESSGLFLRDDPTDDIEAVIDALARPFVDFFTGELHMFPKHPDVYLFVGSFGGPAGLFLSKDPRVTRVFAYSPVVDWRAPMPKEPLKGFAEMTRRLFGEGYRIHRDGERKLLSGKFYNPSVAPYEIDGSKVHLFHTKDDATVAYEPVAQFANQIGARFTGFARGEHGGASSFMEPRSWKRVQKEIEDFEVKKRAHH